MPRPRRLRTFLAAVLLVVIALAAWAGYQAYRVNEALSAAVDDAAAVQRAVEASDADRARAALEDLRTHSGDAADRTSSATWDALGLLPVVGDDVDGVALVSSVVRDLADGGVEPLIATAGDLDSILPRDARVDLRALRRLQAPVAEAADAFARADDRLAGAEPSDFVDRLAVPFRDLAGRVDDARRALSAADTALQVMPSMLGADGDRDFLLVLQNNAEVRATGGLPGAISVLHTSQGRIELVRQVAGNAFGRRASPVLPLTAAERQLYSANLGLYVLDANLTPDFPRAAELIRARWTETQPEDPSGVLSVDPVALSYLLEVAGPVTVGGVELTADNAVDQLLHEVYVRLPEPAAQDEFFRAAARAVFDRISGGVDAPQDLVQALARGAREGRLLVHSFEEDEQAALAGTAVAGELPSEPTTRPQVGAYLNTGIGKMSYFLRHEVRAVATSCAGGRQRLEGILRLESVVEEDAARTLPAYVTGGGSFGTDVGSQLVVANLYGPVGGSIDAVTFKGKPVDPDFLELVEHEGRPVTQVLADLQPGEVSDITWRMTTAEGQTGDVDLRTTPSIEPRGSASAFPSACR